MSLLLCRNSARLPYYIEKADTRIYSIQELCWFIYNYPLILTESPLDNELIAWIKNELSMGILAERLERLSEAGESTENMICLILREGNYYNIDEINSFKQKMSDLKKLDTERHLLAEASTYFRLGRFAEAGDLFCEAERYLRNKIKKNVTEDRNELSERLSDVICDEAVCRLRLFDDDRAKALLLEGAEMAENSRCAEYLYLMDEEKGAKYITEEKKAELSERREEARQKAMLGKNCREVAEIFEKDSVKRNEEIRKLISEWKSVYRKMV